MEIPAEKVIEKQRATISELQYQVTILQVQVDELTELVKRASARPDGEEVAD